MEGRDNIGWRFFGALCGRCFLPKAEVLLKHLEEWEAYWWTIRFAPNNEGWA
ncbi:MAG: hypothetical protein N3G78_11590 [Desulfobacterota bacterium]|nr:hypothetical protein [Thermodesulfobacteriota bacterium]